MAVLATASVIGVLEQSIEKLYTLEDIQRYFRLVSAITREKLLRVDTGNLEIAGCGTGFHHCETGAGRDVEKNEGFSERQSISTRHSFASPGSPGVKPSESRSQKTCNSNQGWSLI